MNTDLPNRVSHFGDPNFATWRLNDLVNFNNTFASRKKLIFPCWQENDVVVASYPQGAAAIDEYCLRP